MSFLTRPITLRGALPICFCLFGAVATAIWNPAPIMPRTEIRPAPYLTPKLPDSTPLRMAMVHDVVMNRYLTHGSAWYEKRNEIARTIIEKSNKSKPAVELLNAMDDLAVGLQRLGKGEEAITLMREKLKLLPPITLPYVLNTPGALDEKTELDLILAAKPLDALSRHQYTTRANLGTFLNLQSFAGLLKKEPGAKEMMIEGLRYVEESIAVNPGAHFGRERWQAILVHHFLIAAADPDFFKSYTMLGDPTGVHSFDAPPSNGKPWRSFYGKNPPDFTSATPAERINTRIYITPHWFDEDWAKRIQYPYGRVIPFDEPTLALLGTWMLGIGPNPHWAMALGRIMDRIGQNHIAWEAYQRAIDLGEGFHPDKEVRDYLINFCQRRQRGIETKIVGNHDTDWQQQMLKSYQDEFAFGTKYQNDYHAFEAKQIAAGVALDDAHFYDAFFAGRPPIASDPGKADDMRVTHLKTRSALDYLPLTILGVGMGMTLGLVLGKKRRA